MKKKKKPANFWLKKAAERAARKKDVFISCVKKRLLNRGWCTPGKKNISSTEPALNQQQQQQKQWQWQSHRRTGPFSPAGRVVALSNSNSNLLIHSNAGKAVKEERKTKREREERERSTSFCDED